MKYERQRTGPVKGIQEGTDERKIRAYKGEGGGQWKGQLKHHSRDNACAEGAGMKPWEAEQLELQRQGTRFEKNLMKQAGPTV